MTNYSLYVLGIIVGCVGGLFITYSINYLATNGLQDTPQEPEMQLEQRQYMRDLRYQNILSQQQQLRYERATRHAPMESRVESNSRE